MKANKKQHLSHDTDIFILIKSAAIPDPNMR